jgi:hypothetical protein
LTARLGDRAMLGRLPAAIWCLSFLLMAGAPLDALANDETIIAKHIIKNAQSGEFDPRWLADSALLYLTQQKLTRNLPDGTPRFDSNQNSTSAASRRKLCLRTGLPGPGPSF